MKKFLVTQITKVTEKKSFTKSWFNAQSADCCFNLSQCQVTCHSNLKNVLNIHVQAGLPNIVLFCYMYIKDLLALFFKITPKKVRLMEHNIPPSRWI